MNIKEILTFIKVTLENNVISAVKSLKEHIFTVKLQSNKVEVVNPTKIPAIVSVKVTNPSKYEKNLKEISTTVEKSSLVLSKELIKGLANLEKLLKDNKQVSVSNLQDIAPTHKIEVTNPQKTVSIKNFYEIQKELGKVKKSIDALKLNPTITVPDVIIPEINIPTINVPKTTVNISTDKMEELLSLLSTDPKKPLAVRLSDGEKFYEALFQAVSGGSSRSYSFQDENGDRGYGLIDEKKRVATSSEDKWGINDIENSGDIIIIGKEDSLGNWVIEKIVESGDVRSFTYATHMNNAIIASYSDAWSARSTVSYDYYSIAF
jgi:hypothetical protein